MHRNPRAAFTLIELLVVVAILALLAAILFPVFARTREKARQATCLSNERQIAHGVRMYMDDYDSTFPFVLNVSANMDWDLTNLGDNGKQPVVPGVTGNEPRFQLVTLVDPYIRNAGVWYCPSVGPDYVWEAMVNTGGWKKGMTMRTQGTTYWYTFLAFPPTNIRQGIFMGGKSDAILQEPGRWPMLSEQPNGYGFTGNLADPPASAVPHSGGMIVAYGDGHAKFHRMEIAEGSNYLRYHAGDGVCPGQ